MSRLTVHRVDDPSDVAVDTTDGQRIAEVLGAEGVRFERWGTRALAADAAPDDVLAAYADEIHRLEAQGGYATADVIRLGPDHPDRAAIRARFLDEHTHAEDEVRFFVEGRGLFFLHLGDRVHRILCETGDLLSVPAGTPHWFDTGARPHVTAIRIFTNPEGWVARYTGTDLAQHFPTLDAPWPPSS